MRTRSKSYPSKTNATIPRRQNKRRVPNIVKPEIRTIQEVVLMADQTMEELLQAPTEGYGVAIVILEILAENFEIKTNLLQLVQTNKFHDFERDNPHTHISNFKRMTSTLKYKDVPNDAIKLLLFLYSLERAARILNDQKLREKATNQMDKFFQIFHDLHFDISFADALLLMPKFASTIKSLLTNKDKLFELAKVPLNENCSAMLLKKLSKKLGDPGKKQRGFNDVRAGQQSGFRGYKLRFGTDNEHQPGKGRLELHLMKTSEEDSITIYNIWG
nr:reverse transcriptase domain-containing protein [Tanacetum cinerariifolium]